MECLLDRINDRIIRELFAKDMAKVHQFELSQMQDNLSVDSLDPENVDIYVDGESEPCKHSRMP